MVNSVPSPAMKSRLRRFSCGAFLFEFTQERWIFEKQKADHLQLVSLISKLLAILVFQDLSGVNRIPHVETDMY